MHERNEDAQKTPKDEQRTPITLYNRLNARFQFDYDLMCTKQNCLCQCGVFADEGCDILSTDFDQLAARKIVGFCNPEYSNPMPFVIKCYNESLKGHTIVMVLPADVSTEWFRVCMAADEWIIINGRVHFNHADGTPIKGSPKFGTICVVFKDTPRRRNLGFPVISSMNWR